MTNNSFEGALCHILCILANGTLSSLGPMSSSNSSGVAISSIVQTFIPEISTVLGIVGTLFISFLGVLAHRCGFTSSCTASIQRMLSTPSAQAAEVAVEAAVVNAVVNAPSTSPPHGEPQPVAI